MPQPSTPTLLTKAELKEWLKVSDMWVRDRLADPEFVAQCVIDLAPAGSSKRTIRYHACNTAAYLGFPAESALASAA